MSSYSQWPGGTSPVEQAQGCRECSDGTEWGQVPRADPPRRCSHSSGFPAHQAASILTEEKSKKLAPILWLLRAGFLRAKLCLLILSMGTPIALELQWPISHTRIMS